MTPGERVGVFGGTFDPPHIGHLIVAGDVVEEAGLDRLVFVPARSAPHKVGRHTSPAEVRAEMVRVAIQGDPRFAFSDIELTRRGVSYTVDTLEAFHESDPGRSLSLVIGADQLAEFHRWRAPGRIAELADVVALSRDGGAPPGPEIPGLRARYVPVTRVDVSSTTIRARVRRGASVRYMVPDAVLSIIEREGLYRD